MDLKKRFCQHSLESNGVFIVFKLWRCHSKLGLYKAILDVVFADLPKNGLDTQQVSKSFDWIISTIAVKGSIVMELFIPQKMLRINTYNIYIYMKHI